MQVQLLAIKSKFTGKPEAAGYTEAKPQKIEAEM
ncbi:hypothetical protein SAMN05216521_102063 [Enterocloster clostridioformis]|uniref:Uncharacterized protein n=1 Tax=Enterocloster clostridioformis TaxID=1531 RepID=A0A1I0GL00_9FIRM|nr:hypothetical protein SAMN05216521_102063 [Enterocloster clostridioformis]SEW16668.1 hypothetical protein SAMN05216528_101278 [Enterocloster clostridioformis]